jgi:hypothetical protein
MKNALSWDVAPCRSSVNRSFGVKMETCRAMLLSTRHGESKRPQTVQGYKISEKTKQINLFREELLKAFFLLLFLLPALGA